MRLMIDAGLIVIQRDEQIKKFVTKYDIRETNDVVLSLCRKWWSTRSNHVLCPAGT